jgi:hypothetical protein
MERLDVQKFVFGPRYLLYVSTEQVVLGQSVTYDCTGNAE